MINCSTDAAPIAAADSKTLKLATFPPLGPKYSSCSRPGGDDEKIFAPCFRFRSSGTRQERPRSASAEFRDGDRQKSAGAAYRAVSGR